MQTHSAREALLCAQSGRPESASNALPLGNLSKFQAPRSPKPNPRGCHSTTVVRTAQEHFRIRSCMQMVAQLSRGIILQKSFA
eukprot:3110867-Alexandrium_andersonii.AAC.1